MQAAARFQMSEDYFRGVYADWIRHVSRGRHQVVPAGVCLIVVGLILARWAWSDEGRPLAPASALLAIGLLMIGWHFWNRWRWFVARRDSGAAGEFCELAFSDEEVSMKGPYSESRLSWEAFDHVVATPRGLFLYLQKDLHVYVPDSALEPIEAKPEIVRRIVTARVR